MGQHSLPLGSPDASRRIRQELQQISERARARYPVLQHQDAIGLGILMVSCGMVVVNAVGFWRGLLSPWVVVLSSAFFLSLLHELEHDLIHRLYFRSRPWLYNVSMLLVWAFRPSTINPWVRRDWHLHHHRVSGTPTDVEERALTNGEPWGVRRVFMSLDTMLSLALRPAVVRGFVRGYVEAQNPAGERERRRLLWRNRLSYLPFGLFYLVTWHGFLVLHAWSFGASVLGLVGPPPKLVDAVLPTLDFLAVTLLMPNALRTFCLHFISSNIHYYGDIETRNVVQQTQVWNAAFLAPLQLFCFNFGSTHAIHHFWVQDPFYLRQLVASEAHGVMRRHGVRFNDFASMRRANRWHRAADAEDANASPLEGALHS